MASLDTAEGGGGGKKGPGVKKAKKLSTRVDMTPMVDLGFLLITFFIFSTTMAQPTAMQLIMPKDTENQEEQTKVKASGALTIMLGKSDGVYYYEGDDPTKIEATDYKKVRDVIINKKKGLKIKEIAKKDFIKQREKYQQDLLNRGISARILDPNLRNELENRIQRDNNLIEL